MTRLYPLIIAIGILGTATAQEANTTVPDQPSVVEIARINSGNAFFLDSNGQIGVAKFKAGLELSAWDYYTDFQWAEAKSIAIGRNLSIVSGTSTELTQAFDSDKDGKLDFFQDMISNWPTKSEGTSISSGPVADAYGRLLFAVAPRQLPKKEGEEQDTSAPLPSQIFSWNPGGQTLTTLATSSLPIAAMAVSQDGLLAAWIQLPSYTEGYYIALVQLPKFDPKKPDEQPISPPTLVPNIIVPAQLTQSAPISQLSFAIEDGQEKLFACCPEANRIIEIRPEMHEGGWGGLVMIREIFDRPIFSVEAMSPDQILTGGIDGFAKLNKQSENFQFWGVRFTGQSLSVDFSQPVNRKQIMSKREPALNLSIIPLEGTMEPFERPEPLIESDGKTVILDLPKLPRQVIVKVDGSGLKSEDGADISTPEMYYTFK